MLQQICAQSVLSVFTKKNDNIPGNYNWIGLIQQSMLREL